MIINCKTCLNICPLEIGVAGLHIDLEAPVSVVTTQCVRRCFPRFYMVVQSAESVTAMLKSINDAAINGPLKRNVTVTP